MNRHEFVTLLEIALAMVLAVGTSLVFGWGIFRTDPTREFVGDIGILIAALAWFTWTFATLLYRDRITAWVHRRGSLSSQPE